MNNIRKLREETGLSQTKFGAKFHLSQQSIAKYESDETAPDIDTLKSMSKYFCTTIDYIVGNTDNFSMPGDDSLIINGNPITRTEVSHLANYRKLSPELRNNVDAIIEALIEKDNSSQ